MWTFFGLDCVLATATRLALAAATTGYAADDQTFQSWAETLRTRPLGSFYATAYAPDHLPGDLWVLKLVVSVYDACGGRDVEGRGFALLLQAVPMFGDLLVALMVLLLVRELRGDESGGRAARWYLLNPATILLTGVWGQWDSLSFGILLTGVWLSMRSRWWLLSPVLVTWAILIKPQLALPCVCVAMLLANRLHLDGLRPRALAARATTLVLVCGATAYALVRPFGVGLVHAPAGGSTLGVRLQEALDAWPYTTLGAANVWMFPVRSLDRRHDGPGWLGVTEQTWGSMMLVAAVVVVSAVALRRLRPAGAVAAAWVATTLAFAAFLLPTRVHERYLFPALVLGLLLAACAGWERRLVVWFWMASLAFTLNLAFVLFGGLHGPRGTSLEFGGGAWLGLSVTMVSLFLALLAWPLVRADRDWVSAPSAD
jgi:dolichyl-phosphate-mannose-protein mannosyltransferase